jgi:hypothetical protein
LQIRDNLSRPGPITPDKPRKGRVIKELLS